MKALVYQGPGEISLEEVAEPTPVADEVLLRVDAAGMARTVILPQAEQPCR